MILAGFNDSATTSDILEEIGDENGKARNPESDTIDTTYVHSDSDFEDEHEDESEGGDQGSDEDDEGGDGEGDEDELMIDQDEKHNKQSIRHGNEAKPDPGDSEPALDRGKTRHATQDKSNDMQTDDTGKPI